MEIYGICKECKDKEKQASFIHEDKSKVNNKYKTMFDSIIVKHGFYYFKKKKSEVIVFI